MSTVTIIGTGNMGQAIAGLVTKGGNTAQILGETDTDQAVTGDLSLAVGEKVSWIGGFGVAA